MKATILLLCLMSFAPLVVQAQKYKHKTEAELAQMTSAQLADDYVNEKIYHDFNLDDDQYWVIIQQFRKDGAKALPRIIKIINEYDPTKSTGRNGKKGERFDAAVDLLEDLDENVVRLRGTTDGRRAITSLDRAIELMRKTGYAERDEYDRKRHDRFAPSVTALKYQKGLRLVDDMVQDTLRIEYRIVLSDAELSEFVSFLIEQYTDYPGWSEKKRYLDETKINELGSAMRVNLFVKPERFREVYAEFKKTK